MSQYDEAPHLPIIFWRRTGTWNRAATLQGLNAFSIMNFDNTLWWGLKYWQRLRPDRRKVSEVWKLRLAVLWLFGKNLTLTRLPRNFIENFKGRSGNFLKDFLIWHNIDRRGKYEKFLALILSMTIVFTACGSKTTKSEVSSSSTTGSETSSQEFQIDSSQAKNLGKPKYELDISRWLDWGNR